MSGKVIRLRDVRQTCQACGMRWRTLFTVFVNRKGWQRHCGGCCQDKDGGAPRPYLGRYPIRER